MQYNQTNKRSTCLQPIHSIKRIKVIPVCSFKPKKPSQPSKLKVDSPIKKMMSNAKNNDDSLKLQQIMCCGGMKLNRRLNQSDGKKRKNGNTDPKTILGLLTNQKLQISTSPDYFMFYQHKTISLLHQSRNLDNPEQFKIERDIPKIPANSILLRKNQQFKKGKELIGFYLPQNYYVSLYHCQDEGKPIIIHPNILPVQGYYCPEEGNQKYYVTHLFEGASLKNLVIEFGSMQQATVKMFMRQIIGGVSKIHSRGLAHNRLNIDNILHDKQGGIFVNYFKASKLPPSKNDKNIFLYYYPPEMILNEDRFYSQKNDIWAIGCITLQLLVQKSIKLSKYHPYNRNINQAHMSESLTAIQKIQAIVRQQQINKVSISMQESITLSSCAQQFLSLCFSINAQKRPTAQQLLIHAFLQE